MLQRVDTVTTTQTLYGSDLADLAAAAEALAVSIGNGALAVSVDYQQITVRPEAEEAQRVAATVALTFVYPSGTV